MVDYFQVPTPDDWRNDRQKAEWVRRLILVLDQLLRPDGAIEESEATTATVVTHAEKLDFVTITQAVNLDTVEADTAASKATLATIASGSPTYSISNDGTDRTFNADAMAGAITSPPTQAEVENIRDGGLELADVVATLIKDLTAKGILDT